MRLPQTDLGPKASVEQMRAEAAQWMNILGMPQECVDAFTNGVVTVIEPSVLGNGYYCAPCGEDRWPIHFVVDKLQEDSKKMVYAILKNYMAFGEIYTGLFVPCFLDDWAVMRDQLEKPVSNAHPDQRTTDALCWTFPRSATLIQDGFMDFGSVTLDVSRGFPVRVG